MIYNFFKYLPKNSIVHLYFGKETGMGIHMNDYRESGINSASDNSNRSQSTSVNAAARTPAGNSPSVPRSAQQNTVPVPGPVASKALSDAGLPDNARNRQIVSSLISQELPIDAETLKSVIRTVSAYPNESIDAVILLQSAGIEVSPSSLADANAFLSARDMLLDALNDIDSYMDNASAQSNVSAQNDAATSDSNISGNGPDKAGASLQNTGTAQGKDSSPANISTQGNAAAPGSNITGNGADGAGSLQGTGSAQANVSAQNDSATSGSNITGNGADVAGSLQGTGSVQANVSAQNNAATSGSNIIGNGADRAGAYAQGAGSAQSAGFAQAADPYVQSTGSVQTSVSAQGNVAAPGSNITGNGANQAGASAQGADSAQSADSAQAAGSAQGTGSAQANVSAQNDAASPGSNIAGNGTDRAGAYAQGAGSARSAGSAQATGSAQGTGSPQANISAQGNAATPGSNITENGPDGAGAFVQGTDSAQAGSSAQAAGSARADASAQGTGSVYADDSSRAADLSQTSFKDLMAALSEKPGVERSDISSEGIRRFLESAVSYLQNARELSHRRGDETMAAKVDKAMNSMRTLLKLNDMYAYAEVPVKNEDENRQTHLRFFANKKARIRKDEGSSAVLHLNMPSLKELDVKMVLKGKSLKIDFFSSKDASPLLEADSGSLSEKLRAIGVDPAIDFKERTINNPELDPSNIPGQEITSVPQNIKGFDTRA
ncbi:MAG: hypothetical protein K6F44_03930 [Lachnospiraceae bacterium]|nr:hypothetical protein [Lachnospiraceae bacterium]